MSTPLRISLRARTALAIICAISLCLFMAVRLQSQGKIFLDGYFPGVFTLNPSAFSGSVSLPCGALYGLDNGNNLRVYQPAARRFVQTLPIKGLVFPDEQIIGVDWRPANGGLHFVGDSGNIYQAGVITGRGVSVSLLPPAPGTGRFFDGGVQSLADFNPVVDALRLIGSNDQNVAVVNVGGNLATSALQTALTYPAGDVNAGADPNIVAGAYTNNVNGAPFTIFYAIDFALDTLVTIPPTSPGGSSATGGGRLQTIGRIFGPDGARLNFAPTCDVDIITTRNADGSLSNLLVGLTGAAIFTIDLAQISPALPLGQTQNVVAQGAALNEGGLIDAVFVPCRR